MSGPLEVLFWLTWIAYVVWMLLTMTREARAAWILRHRPAYQVTREVLRERKRQDAKWGQQNHLDGTGTKFYRAKSTSTRIACQTAFASGEGTWAHVLLEEVYEALAETDPELIAEELVQVAAVAVAWVEHIDRRLDEEESE